MEGKSLFSSSRGLVFAVVVLSVSAQLAQSAEHPRKSKTDIAVNQLQEQMQSMLKVVTQQQDTIRELRDEVQRLAEANGKVATATESVHSMSDRAENDAQQAQQIALQAQKAADHAEFRAAEANTAGSMQKDELATGRKKIDAIEDLLGRFRPAGDVRMRFEPIYQDLTPARYRPRLRVRFGVEGKVSEDVTGGFYLATGSVNDDPVSTNQTLTQFFTRKSIGLDRGWITYRPSAAKWRARRAG